MDIFKNSAFSDSDIVSSENSFKNDQVAGNDVAVNVDNRSFYRITGHSIE